MRNTKITTGLVILLIVGLLTAIVWGSKDKKETLPPTVENKVVSETPVPVSISSGTPVFFYGNTCPHCADIEAWMKENKIEEKISIIKKEVYDNRQNAQELTRVADGCGLPTDSIGVPFLYTEGKCLIGTPDIISYLTEKAKTLEATSSAERRAE